MDTPAMNDGPEAEAEARDRLIALIHTYTGESHSDCSARIMPHVMRLSLKDLTLLGRDLTSVNFKTLGRLRRALLPDACTPEQAALEAVILAALPAVAESTGMWKNPIVQAIPSPHELGLYVKPRMLLPLLLAVLPRVVNGRIEGCPGLRATPTKLSLVLHWADSPGSALRIHDTLLKDFPRICRIISRLAGSDDAVELWAPGYGHGKGLSAAELVATAALPSRRPMVDAVASALLRRSAVWPDGLWRREGGYHAYVSAEPRTMTESLSHKLYGIPYRVLSTTDRVLALPDPIGDLEQWRCDDHRSVWGA